MDQLAMMGPSPGMGGLAAGPPPGAPDSIQIGGDQGPPPDQAAPQEGGDGSSPVDILSQMRDLAVEYMHVEPDDIDKQTMAGILKELQALFAKDQKEQEAASGTTPAMKGIAKALGG